MSIKRALTIVLLASLSIAGLTLPARAADASTTFVTMFGNGDYIAGNNSYLWREGAGTISVSGSATGVSINVSGGTGGSYFTFDFGAPTGENLVPGRYDGAQRFSSTGVPRMDIYGSGRGCNTVTGHFTVLDYASDGSRVWIVYEHHCEGGTKSAFGEIRYNEPGGDSDLLVAPDRIAWPDQGEKTSARTIPVTLVNTGASSVTVSSATISTGADAFTVAGNGCTTLAVGDSCVIQVGFTPPSIADFTGTLQITDSTAAGTHQVSLSGTGVAVPVTVKVATNRGKYGFGATAKVTGTVKGSYEANPLLSIYKKVGRHSRVLVTTQSVDSFGKVHTAVAVQKKTKFIAEWTYDTQTVAASKVVYVHAKVAESMRRYLRRKGKYFLYKKGSRMVTLAKVSPNKHGKCLYFRVEFKVNGSWQYPSTTGCVTISAKSKAGAYLDFQKGMVGIPMRFRGEYRGDKLNLAKNSRWRYAKFIR